MLGIKRIVVWRSLGAIACCMSALCFLAVKFEDRASARVFLRHPTKDFGCVKQAELLSSTFKLVNNSFETVRIERVTQSCGCTTPKFDSNEIHAGTSLTIELRWDVGYGQGPSAATVTLLLRSASGREYIETINLQAHIIPEISIEPPSLTFKRHSREAQRAKIRLTANTIPNLEIKTAYVQHPDINVSVDKESPSTTILEVNFDTSVNTQISSGIKLIVETNAVRIPKLAIPVTFVSSQKIGD